MHVNVRNDICFSTPPTRTLPYVYILPCSTDGPRNRNRHGLNFTAKPSYICTFEAHRWSSTSMTLAEQFLYFFTRFHSSIFLLSTLETSGRQFRAARGKKYHGRFESDSAFNRPLNGLLFAAWPVILSLQSRPMKTKICRFGQLISQLSFGLIIGKSKSPCGRGAYTYIIVCMPAYAPIIRAHVHISAHICCDNSEGGRE